MKKIIILTPVYNDWKSVFKLLESIDLQIEKWDAEVSVMIVNDASTEERPKSETSFKNIKSIRVMNMIKNRGHARCYAAGLKYLNEKENFDYVIQMDGDGEDRPEELTSLFNKSNENPSKTVTLNRTKRSEGPWFKLLYELGFQPLQSEQQIYKQHPYCPFLFLPIHQYQLIANQIL